MSETEKTNQAAPSATEQLSRELETVANRLYATYVTGENNLHHIQADFIRVGVSALVVIARAQERMAALAELDVTEVINVQATNIADEIIRQKVSDNQKRSFIGKKEKDA